MSDTKITPAQAGLIDNIRQAVVEQLTPEELTNDHTVHFSHHLGTHQIPGEHAFIPRKEHSGAKMTICIIAPKDMNDEIKEAAKLLESIFNSRHQK